MANLTNSHPRFIFGGINDQSRGTIPLEAETFAQHLPLVRIFAQDGPSETFYIGPNSGSFADIYGSDTLNRRSKYFNTQSLLVEQLLEQGNGLFVKRLIPDDAEAPARLILAMDIVEDDIPRTIGSLDGFDYPTGEAPNPDGYVVNENGDIETVPGYRARLVLIEDTETEVGGQSVVDGAFVSERDGTQSTLYPLFELPTRFVGEGGQLKGIRLWAPTTNDAIPFDESVAEAFKTRVYRIQMVKRSADGGSPVTVRTRSGEEYVDVTFTPGAYSPSTDREYYIGDTLIDAYEDDGITTGTAPRFAPFSDIHVYQDNITAIQEMIYAQELHALVNPAAAAYLEAASQIDIFTGREADGDQHVALHLEGPMSGGLRLSSDTVLYASGGSDGTISLEEYERLVTRENVNFGELDDQYENLAMFPFSVIYDTGLSMAGKRNMMRVLGRRQDVRCVFTTYVEADGRAPTASEELSRCQALMADLRAFPESILYGTGVCRAEIILQTGRLANGNYLKPVPQVIDYATRWADFAGAATGIMRAGRDIDKAGNKRVTAVRDLNVTFFNTRMQSELWNNGGTYSLTYDRRSQYYPAIQSVYTDKTSVLVSPITVHICCDIIRLMRLVHAEFSGDSTLTAGQLIERCEDMTQELVNGRYNDRVNITPEFYYTEGDIERGYSWHGRVRVEANNVRTVMVFDLETQRMGDN
jgi:hypothetical protein